MLQFFCCLLVLIAYTHAHRASPAYGTPTSLWVKSAVKPDPNSITCSQIAIKHDASTVASVISSLLSRSSIDSEQYGLWLSQKQIYDTLHQSGSLSASRSLITDFIVDKLPKIKVIEAVHAPAHDGLTELSSTCGRCRHDNKQTQIPWVQEAGTGDFLVLCLRVSEAEVLYNAELDIFSHLTDGTDAIRASSGVNLPASIEPLVDFIGGINTPIHRNQAKFKRMDAMPAASPSSGKSVSSSATFSDVVASSNDRDDFLVGSRDECAMGDQSPTVLSIIAGNEEFNIVWQANCGVNRTEEQEAHLPPCFVSWSSHAVSKDSSSPTFITSSYPYIKSFDLVVWDQYKRPRIFAVPSSSCENRRCTASVPLNNYDSVRVQVRASFSDGLTWCSYLSLPVAAVEFATVNFLSGLYGIPPGLRSTSSLAVVEFLEQYYNPSDLDEYLELHGLERQQQMGPYLVGPNVPKLGAITGGEAQLDIQIAAGVAYGAPLWFWSVPNRESRTNNNLMNAGSQEPFLSWLFDLSDSPNPPLVQSVSYGDLESEVTIEYAERLNFEFAKCGLRGLTLIFAAGDSGVNGEPNIPEPPIDAPSSTTPAPQPVAQKPSLSARDPNTAVNDISNTIKISKTTTSSSALCKVSAPNFPASSPWVLTVGATQLSSRGSPMCQKRWHGTTIGCEPREVVCSAAAGGIITSGGGFSNIYSRPAYQDSAVRHYLSKGHERGALPHHDFFNASGRAYPDITAYGTAFPILMNGTVVPVAGTSASTPVIASLISLWNSYLVSSGLPPLGFINPALYALAERQNMRSVSLFNDVIVGDNSCAERGQACCPRGFKAMNGWDAASGLGSPRFLELRSAFYDAGALAQLRRRSSSSNSASVVVEPQPDLDKRDLVYAVDARTAAALSSSSSSSSAAVVLGVAACFVLLVAIVLTRLRRSKWNQNSTINSAMCMSDEYEPLAN